MGADHFVKVFDIASSGFKDWQFPAFGLIFVAIGSAIFFAPALIKRLGIPYLNFPSKRLTFFRYGFLGFTLFWTVTAFSATYSAYSHHRDLVERNACAIVEGPVTNFVPMPYEGHANESFSVSGIAFEYSDYGASDAFNNTSSHGGPINKDAYVRICYDPSDHAILRLEIRDYQKLPKDYSRGDHLFGDLEPNNQSVSQIAPHENRWMWLADVWVSFYFLDIILILAMFVPYLRTFWRIKTIPIAEMPIPAWFERGRKIKLQNSLAYWDTTEDTIWLRPRGFNFFRIPLTVAKLKAEGPVPVIANGEIRFSSGMPVILALFLFSAFQLFSATMPGGTQMAAMFVGFAGLMALVSAFFYRKQFVSRMQMVVQDALDELTRRAKQVPP